MKVKIVSWNIENLGHVKLGKMSADKRAVITEQVAKKVDEGALVFILEARTADTNKNLLRELVTELKSGSYPSMGNEQDVLTRIGSINSFSDGSPKRNEYVLAIWDKSKLDVSMSEVLDHLKHPTRLYTKDELSGEVRAPLVVDVKEAGVEGDSIRVAAWHAPGPANKDVIASSQRKIITAAQKHGVDVVCGDFNTMDHAPSEDTASSSTQAPTHGRRTRAVARGAGGTTKHNNPVDKAFLISDRAEISGMTALDPSTTTHGKFDVSDHIPIEFSITKETPTLEEGEREAKRAKKEPKPDEPEPDSPTIS